MNQFASISSKIGEQMNQTTTTTTEAPKKVAPATTTPPTTTTPTPTTGRVMVGPTKRSRAPANSSVVFPALKNKPGFVNSSYLYEYTQPQKIRVNSFNQLLIHQVHSDRFRVNG